MRYATRILSALVVGLVVFVAAPAQAQTVSGFENTSFSISFDGSSVDQIGNDGPNLVFRDVSFGVSVPVTENLGVWASVSKAADFNRDAEDQKLTGSFAGGLSYLVAQGDKVSFSILGGVLSRLERVGDQALNPTAARAGAKIGYRVFGDPSDSRWFGLFVEGGSDFALRDIMSMSDGDIMQGDTTYHYSLGLEFSL